MVGQVWAELRYGVGDQGIALCKVDNPDFLRLFKQCALTTARQFAEESKGIDRIIYTQDQAELEKLQALFELVIPDSDESKRLRQK